MASIREDTAPKPARTGISRRFGVFWERMRRGRFDIGLLLRPIVPRHLFGRSLIIIVAPLVLTQLIVTYVFFERHWDVVTRRLSSGVAGNIAMVLEQYDALDSAEGFDALAAQAARTMRLNVAYWEGQKLPPNTRRSFFSVLDRTLEKELSRRLDRPFWFDTTGYPRHVDIRIETKTGIIRVIVHRSRVFATNAYIFVLWMFASGLILLGVAVLFLRGQVRPIQRLAEAAEQFGKGVDVPNFKPAGALEVRSAAEAFIAMKDRIQKHIQQRTEMLAGVSHDLRTNLTRMKLQLAFFDEGPEAEAMRSDIEEMEHMLSEYLDFARGQGGESPRDVELEPYLQDIVTAARRNEHDIDLILDSAPLTVTIRENGVRRALTNLIENARRHGTRTEVRTQTGPNALLIYVDDNGPGIPEDKREEAFRPFHRLDEARNLDTGGVGLGLAISRDIIRGHGGDLTLDISPLGGLRAVVRLPV